MVKNKKPFVLLSALAMLSLSACGQTPVTPTTSSEEKIETTSETQAESSKEAPATSSEQVIPTFRGIYENGTFPISRMGSEYKGAVADPSTPRLSKDGYYYVYATDLVCVRSADLCEWELVSTNFMNKPTWTHTGSSCYFWAPDVIQIGDQWVMYYAIHDTVDGTYWDSIGYATADDPAGPWIDGGELMQGPKVDNPSCIDPAPFIDDDGTIYLVYGSFSGIDLVQLTSDGTEVANLEPENYADGQAYAKAKHVRITYGACEGPYITKRNGKYYLYNSLGSCCSGADSTYRVCVAIANDITGPYIDANRVNITATGVGGMNVVALWSGAPTNPDRVIYGPGHNSIFQDANGDDWIIYHGYFGDDNYSWRHLMIDPLVYDDKGFPAVPGRMPSYHEEKDGPLLPEVPLL